MRIWDRLASASREAHGWFSRVRAFLSIARQAVRCVIKVGKIVSEICHTQASVHVRDRERTVNPGVGKNCEKGMESPPRYPLPLPPSKRHTVPGAKIAKEGPIPGYTGVIPALKTHVLGHGFSDSSRRAAAFTDSLRRKKPEDAYHLVSAICYYGFQCFSADLFAIFLKVTWIRCSSFFNCKI